MATSTIYTTKDTYANESNPDTSYGTTNDIRIDEDPGSSNYGYVGFDITSAPTASQTTNVLFYYYRSLYAGTPTGYFRRTTSSWAETLTWNTGQPSVTDTNMATCAFAASSSWGSCNITNMYKDAKNAGNDLGIQLKQSTSNDIGIASRETTYDSYIYITYGAITDYYVKTTGNDSLDGLSWTNAWATVNKAATTVADGSTVHIGFGDYTSEPASNKIAPQNIGASGIYYLPETATTGGGTGTVSVEQNV